MLDAFSDVECGGKEEIKEGGKRPFFSWFWPMRLKAGGKQPATTSPPV
jgi:hypothetical protein